jgi:hypothetical protein
VYYARDLFYGVFAGNNGEIQIPGFHARVDEKFIEMDSHEFQIIGSAFDDRLHYTGGIFLRTRKDVAEVNPQTFSLPIAFVATSKGSQHAGAGPAVRRSRFLPGDVRRVPVRGLAAVADSRCQ